MKPLTTGLLAIPLFPLLAQADTQATSGDTSTLANLFWGILPFVILVLFFFIFLRKPMNRSRQLQADYKLHMERQVQHMERVEQSLDRMVTAIEKKD